MLAVTMLLSALCASARSIPAREALDRALRSEKQSAGMRRSPSMPAEYSLAYSAPAGTYHVYNRSTGGYIVVSGDDEIYPLLADVGDGVFVMDELSPATRWMLDSYDRQISSFATSDDADMGLADYYNRWGEIDPIMTTRWDQLHPYNKYCPVQGGRTCVTGCVATALAQVVHSIGYYKGSGYRYYNGVNSNGERVEFDYASATFDFRNMIDYYPTSAPVEAINETGRLMLACGLAVSMNYSPSGSGASSLNVPRALVEHFGYDAKHTRLYDTENYNQAQWENMLHRQLELGRPVYYSGAGLGAAHAFVIDGYRPTGLYHVNWGWGGMSDGYFRLTALNPNQIGTGGGNGGYNQGQEMVFAVPPGADPGVIYGEMSGSIRMVSDGVYALYYKSNGTNLMNVCIGAVIADASDNAVATATFWQNQNITASSALRHDSYSYDFSQHQLAPGEYRIYPAFCPEGGEYTIADAFYDRQHFVTLTVTREGRYIVENNATATFETDVRIAGIVPGYDLCEGFSGYVGFYVVNNGNLDYQGPFSITLLGSDGEVLASERSQRAKVAAGVNTTIYCPVPVFDTGNKLIPPGTYPIRFTDGDGRLLSDGEFSINIRKGRPLSEWDSDEYIEVTNCTSVPEKLLSGELWPHTPLIKTTRTHRNMTLGLAFYPPSGVSPAYTLNCYDGTIEPMQSTFPLGPIAVKAPFGSYQVCYRKNYSQISQRCPIRIGLSVDGIGYYPTAGEGVSATMTESMRSSEEVIVPARVNINGTDRTVTAMEPDAFMGCRDLAAIELPDGIEEIGLNAFINCPSLRQIVLRSERPPFAYRNFIAPGLNATTEFYVPASAYDAYEALLRAYHPVYTLVESIESKDTVVTTPSSTLSLTVYPAHEAINPAFVITPADDASAGMAEVKVASVRDGVLRLDVHTMHSGTATFHVRPAHRSDDYAVVTITQSGEATGIGCTDIPADAPTGAVIHTVSGVRVWRDIKDLPAGVYIVNGRKMVVK